VGTASSSWILSSAVTFAAAVLWFLDTFFFNMRRSLLLSVGFRPLFLSADGLPMICVCRHNLGNRCSGYS
jgi:hypothetical protein